MRDNQFSALANEITFLVVSCDKYKDLWGPFFKCFFEFWKDCPFEICLASNHIHYLDKRVRTITIGDDNDYSTNISLILKEIKTPWLIFWFEDAWISSKVDTKYLLKIINLAISENVGSLKLTDDYPWVYSDNEVDIIAPIPKGVKYRGAIGMSLYKKDLLKAMIRPGESAWELDKSVRTNLMSDKFYAFTTYGLKKPIFVFQHAVVKSKWTYTTPKFLKKYGFEILVKSRKKESFFEYMYGNIYQLRLTLFKLFKLYWKE